MNHAATILNGATNIVPHKALQSYNALSFMEYPKKPTIVLAYRGLETDTNYKGPTALEVMNMEYEHIKDPSEFLAIAFDIAKRLENLR